MAGLPDGLILAAGAGRRFGSDKRQARLADGTPLLLATVATWRKALPRLRIVLRPGDDRLRARLLQRWPELTFTLATDWEMGMGASLAAGARDCDDGAPLLIGLGDMPWLQHPTLSSVADSLATATRTDALAIVRPRCEGRWGHPVGFGPAHVSSLRELNGDAGARSLIDQHRQHLQALPCKDPGCLRDVDYPADLAEVSAST